MKKEKFIFIDRDGVINVDNNYPHKTENLFFYLDALNFLLRSQKLGYRIFIVTNQSGIGRSYFSDKEFNMFMREYFKILSFHKIKNIELRYCPHKPSDNCDCRKPKIGLINDLLKKNIIDKEMSWMIGDKLSDINFGRRIGLKNLTLIRRSERITNCKNLISSYENYYITNSLINLIYYI